MWEGKHGKRFTCLYSCVTWSPSRIWWQQMDSCLNHFQHTFYFNVAAWNLSQGEKCHFLFSPQYRWCAFSFVTFSPTGFPQGLLFFWRLSILRSRLRLQTFANHHASFNHPWEAEHWMGLSFAVFEVSMMTLVSGMPFPLLFYSIKSLHFLVCAVFVFFPSLLVFSTSFPRTSSLD